MPISKVDQYARSLLAKSPGVIAVPAQGPVGYFGSPEAAAERLIDQVAALAGVECQAGIADGLFAADLAARSGPAGNSGGGPRDPWPARTYGRIGPCFRQQS